MKCKKINKIYVKLNPIKINYQLFYYMQYFSKLWSISPELIILYVFVLSNTSRCSNGQINVILMVRERTRYFWTFRWHSTFCNFIWKAPAMQSATDNLYRIVLTGNAVYVWLELQRFILLPLDGIGENLRFVEFQVQE